MKAVLYGIGQRYRDLFFNRENVDAGMMANEIEVTGFADGNPGAWGREVIYNGLRYKISDIMEIPRDDYDNILVVSKDYFEEIRSALCKKGWERERIRLIDDFFDAGFERIHSAGAGYLDRQWDMLEKAGGSVSLFLESENYRDIAVYGTGAWARRLTDDFMRSSLRLRYFIGNTDDFIVSTDGVIGNTDERHFADIPVLGEGEELPDADIIVAAAADEDYMDVERRLCERNHVEVISIQELICRALKNPNGERK